MENHLTLEALQQADICDAETRGLNELINTSEKALRMRKAEKQKLILEKKEKQKEVNELLEQQKNKREFALTPRKQTRGQNFFKLLRNLEAEEETLSADIEAIVPVIKSLSDSIKALKTKNNKLIEEKERLLSIEKSTAVSVKEKDNLLRAENMKIDDLTVYEEKLILDTEKLKTLTETKHSEINEMMTGTEAEVSAQLAELRQRENILQSELENHKKAIKTIQKRIEFEEEKAKSLISEKSSTSSWMSERNSLLAKVKVARRELTSYRKRQKSTEASKYSTSARSKALTKESDAKKALIAEIEELKADTGDFYSIAIDMEKERAKDIEKEMAAVTGIINRIDSFRSKLTNITMSNMKLTGEKALTDLLSMELKEMRESL